MKYQGEALCTNSTNSYDHQSNEVKGTSVLQPLFARRRAAIVSIALTLALSQATKLEEDTERNLEELVLNILANFDTQRQVSVSIELEKPVIA